VGKELVTGDSDDRKEQIFENSFSMGGRAFAGSELHDPDLNSCSGCGMLPELLL
jgi:hypothetical protein